MDGFGTGGKKTIEVVRPTLRKKSEGWGTRAFEVVQFEVVNRISGPIEVVQSNFRTHKMGHLAKQRKLKAKADPPFDFAQGRLFGDDNRTVKALSSRIALQRVIFLAEGG
jgi:hypothetical protein